MSVAGLLAEIAEIGRDEARGGYSRHLFDEADLELRAWFEDRAAELGLRMEHDGNGNLWAWWDAGDADAGAIATGSHLDSVPGGGAYDGPLGVVSALEAVRILRADGFVPSRPIAVCVFAEEEGSRFNAPCLGSRLLVGDADPQALRARTDAEGLTLGEVWAGAGHDPDRMGADPALLARLAAFVELHVEQGRDLVDRGSAVAVATAIIPHGRWRARFEGAGNHAGTTPMSDRHDPVVALAAGVLAVREVAAAGGPLARGTVGRVRVTPGGSNVIASRAEAWIDLRAETDDEVRALLERTMSALGAAAETEGCTLTVFEESFSSRVDFDADLRDRIARVLGEVPGVAVGGSAGGIPGSVPGSAPGSVPGRAPGSVPAIPTGAGHDAGILAPHVPTAMIFVRNPTGVSHAPGEGASDEDCETGARGLAAVLRDLAGAPR